MAEGRLELVDKTVQTTYKWVNELADQIGWHDRHKSFRMLRATLHALRDLLQVNEAVQLGAQLPTLIRGVYYEGWKPAQRAKSEHSKKFFDRVQIEMYPDLVEDINVFTLLTRHVSAGEISDVKNCMPPELRKLWN